MSTRGARLLVALLALVLLAGCTKEDTRAQAVLERVDQVVSAVVVDPHGERGMVIEVDAITWTARSSWVDDQQVDIPELAVGTPVTVLGPRDGDRPSDGDRVLLYLAYQAPQWVTMLVGDPDSGEITGSSDRARHAREALAAGIAVRGPDSEAKQIAIELVEGAHEIDDATDGHGDPATAGGLMREVTPRLSAENGGPRG